MNKVDNKYVDTPNPGSDEAIKQGCLCAVMDNCHGRGCGRSEDGKPLFWITGDCPLHGEAAMSKITQ